MLEEHGWSEAYSLGQLKHKSLEGRVISSQPDSDSDSDASDTEISS
jgi:hypothetical protein